MNLITDFTKYLSSRYNHLSLKTIRNYKADVGMFISWYQQKFNSPLNTNQSWINNKTIDIYRQEKIVESNLSPRSFKRHLSSLRKFFEFLKIEGVISEDPFKIKTSLDQQSRQDDKWHLRSFRSYLYENNKSNLTIKNYIFDIQRFLAWAEHLVGERIFNNIDEFLFNEYKKSLLQKGLSVRTIKRNFSSLQKYLTWVSKEVPKEISNFKKEIRADFKTSQLRHSGKARSAGSIQNLSGQEVAASDSGQARMTSFKITPRSNIGFFPPLRLIQKIIAPINFIFEALTYSIAKIKGKPIFKEVSSVNYELQIRNLLPEKEPSETREELPNEQELINLPKGLYNRFPISIDRLPLHKKILHHIRHKRPKWYKIYHSYSITDYIHLSFLILSMSILGFAIYDNLSTQREKSVLSSFTAYPPRILSFKGRLTDNSSSPITRSNTPLRVAIYSHQIASGAALLWQETVNVNPDPNGMFSAFIGTNNPIPPSIFSEGEALWLGLTIADSPELTPRQQLSNVAKALDSEKLQGLVPITNPDAGTKNVVLSLDSSGNLTIGEDANPTFQATGGRFKLLGETLVLSTTPGTNSNVEITPMDLGKIDLQKPIFNSTINNNVGQAIGSVEIDDSLAILATTSAQSAFAIDQKATGNLISAYTNGVEKFTINNNGNIISATGTRWQPFSDSTSALNIANAAGTSFLTFDTSNSRLRFLYDSKERAELFYLNSDSAFHIRSASSLALDTDNSSNPAVYIATSGNLGIGTITPASRLDVQDSKSATAAAQIFNTDTGNDADGLIVKLGNTSTTVNNNNRFISFETSGIGIVGSVRGDGSTGVEFKTEGIADFAEYLKKDKNQTIESGSIICIDERGLALPCDNTYNKIIGVSSNQGGFTGGKDNKEESIRVGFIGQVYTKVATNNSSIKPGDPLTSSSIPGVAVKAVDKGQIVGKALESLDDTKILGYYDIEKKEYIDKSTLSPNILISQYPNLIPFGKILVSIGVSWYDPTPVNLSQNLSENEKAAEEKDLKDRISAAKFDLVAVIQDYMNPRSRIISPIAKVHQIDSDIISPLASDSLTSHSGPLRQSVPPKARLAKGGSEASLSRISLSSEGHSASDSGGAPLSGASQNDALEIHNASGSADQIVGLSDGLADGLLSPMASHSPSFMTKSDLVPSISEDSPIFPQGIISFGPTSLSDTSINGQLYIGQPTGGLRLKYNSIDVLGTDLALQPLRQGGLSIMGDLVYIDTDGNIKVEGNAEFAKDVEIKGNLVASGSATFAKLNLTSTQPALAVSSTNVIATGSAGTSFVRSYEIQVTIKNALVTDKSLIYVTPVGSPSAQIPYLIRQEAEEPNLSPSTSLGINSMEGSFTVGIASKSATKTPFNWLIIN